MIILKQERKKYRPRAVKNNKDSINWNGSSDILKKSVDFNKITNFRFKIIGSVICLIFVVLIVQLVNIQVYQQELYQQKLVKFTTSYQKISPPRGQIYDRNKVLLVENTAYLNIIYTPPKNATNESKWESAKKLVEHYNLSIDSYTIRDLQDAYINLDKNACNDLITEQEWTSYYAKEITDNDIYQLKLSRISEEILSTIDPKELMASIIKINMDKATSTVPSVILEDIPYVDAIYIAEHKTDFPGFDNSYDWQRNYLYGDLLKNVLGSVSTKKQGLESESKSYFVALGYSINERIGISGLEKQYEDLLKGEYMYLNTVYDSETNLPIQEIVDEGKKGYDIRISIDVELQQKVEEIVSNTLLEATTNPYRKYFKELYIAMIEPSTGEILAMTGKEQIGGEIYDKSYGVYMDAGAAVPGSAVKGATIYMGLNEGVIKENTYFLDTPLYFAGTPVKASFKNMGLINEIDALKYSSNVYMFRLAMKMAGANYIENGPLVVKNRQETFLKFRSYFRAFGLGEKTGIDLPGESVGYILDRPSENGHLLDYVIGQFDTYTVLQLAKYVATIANDGIRVTPHLLVEAYETGTDNVVYTYGTNVERVIDNTKALKRVQEGLRECVATGYCSTYLNQVSEKVAAKSGTAESYFYNEKGELVPSPNNAFIGYAPYDNPKVAIACVAPHSWNDTSQFNVCQKVIADSLQSYFDLENNEEK